MKNQMLTKGPQRIQAEARAAARKPMIQALKKDGKWGAARQTQRYGIETDVQVVERLERLNPNTKFRIAQ